MIANTKTVPEKKLQENLTTFMEILKHVAKHQFKGQGEVQGEDEGKEKTGNPLKEKKKKKLILSSVSPCWTSSSTR